MIRLFGPGFRMIVLSVVMLASASAAVVQYGTSGNPDQSVFNSLIQGSSTITFQTGTPGLPGMYITNPGYTENGVSLTGFQAGGSFMTVIDWFPDWGTGGVLRAYGGDSQYLHIALPSDITAVGLNLMTLLQVGGNYEAGGTLKIVVNGDVANPFSVPTSYWSSLASPSPGAGHVNPAWFGLSSDTPIATLDITSTQGSMYVDNLQYGRSTPTGSDTPEATTLVMIGTGLAAIRVLRRGGHGRLA